MRRKLQRIGKQHILFLDETHKREGRGQLHDRASGAPPYIETLLHLLLREPLRHDRMLQWNTTLPPIIYSPSERDRGVTREMLLPTSALFSRSPLARWMCTPSSLVDRSPIHSEEKI